jgi:hypothetical protein
MFTVVTTDTPFPLFLCVSDSVDLISCVWTSEVEFVEKTRGKQYDLFNKVAPFFSELRYWTLKYIRISSGRDETQKQDLKLQV